MLRPEPRIAYERLVRVLAERRAADEAAMADVRAKLPQVVRLLVDRYGATRVVLFGSLAIGLFHHARSDVDLAVDGIDFAALGRAEMEATARLGRRVDLVRSDDTDELLRHEIERRGVVLHGS